LFNIPQANRWWFQYRKGLWKKVQCVEQVL
jgi:hypothetical protein